MSIKYSEILERMKRIANLKNDSQVAKAVGITPQAFSNYKKRAKIPSDLILKFAGIYDVSVDWLLTGEGKSEAPSKIAAEAVAPYGKEPSPQAIAQLSPDELIYVGKLLRIMRGCDKSTVSVLKWSIDAFLRATEDEEAKEERKEA